ncbi:MAG: ATP-binding cassette domain-containing protein [Ignavibacteriales bacterium]|jgi:ABC-2 type transport system ATP-binding protein|nr:ATP-binding cassette domain-containing protein [Ignavibacteriaceae bacterium]NLH60134.1 ATP-binding cassette domain-containing protein [Ignavibacteriales bacterium]HOJ17252.1 ATP-binding cassette domain-containing protein [Ignavibacteriaceae bacterium]HPO54441.1 ATP-binding cassette domain-containing protein [Ignavibacteriaceae bacterium]
MLEVINLKKEYQTATAVDGISFRVEKGKIFGLLGPNGAGKTTTIRIILDILKPTSGEIRFDGKPIDKEFVNHTGYLPEERGLYQKSRVIDIIRYFSELKNVHANQAIENGVEWLKRLEISQYKDRKLEELSKGNQQKIQFITAILHNPDVLILDEPFSGFDPINQQLIKDIILSYVDNGKTMILSTHQMDMAEKLCDEIFLIDKGKEVVGGNINEVRKKYGKNSIRVDFSGDKSLISSIPGIVEINVYSNYAEIELNESTKPSEILKKLVDIVEIRNFTILEPSLNKIFIDLIKKSSE